MRNAEIRAEKPPARIDNVLAIIDVLRFNNAPGMFKKIKMEHNNPATDTGAMSERF